MSKEEVGLVVRYGRPHRVVELGQLMSSGKATKDEERELRMRLRYSAMFWESKKKHFPLISTLPDEIAELEKKNKAQRERMNRT